MSFDIYNILCEQCSICKDCGATKENCANCETGKLISSYEQEEEDIKYESDFECGDEESGDLETTFRKLLSNP